MTRTVFSRLERGPGDDSGGVLERRSAAKWRDRSVELGHLECWTRRFGCGLCLRLARDRLGDFKGGTKFEETYKRVFGEPRWFRYSFQMNSGSRHSFGAVMPKKGVLCHLMQVLLHLHRLRTILDVQISNSVFMHLESSEDGSFYLLAICCQEMRKES